MKREKTPTYNDNNDIIGMYATIVIFIATLIALFILS